MSSAQIPSSSLDEEKAAKEATLRQAIIAYIKAGKMTEGYLSVEELRNRLRALDAKEMRDFQHVTGIDYLPKPNGINSLVYAWNKCSENRYLVLIASSIIAVGASAACYFFAPSTSTSSLLLMEAGTGCGSFLISTVGFFDYYRSQAAAESSKKSSRFNEIFGENFLCKAEWVESKELIQNQSAPAHLARGASSVRPAHETSSSNELQGLWSEELGPS